MALFVHTCEKKKPSLLSRIIRKSGNPRTTHSALRMRYGLTTFIYEAQRRGVYPKSVLTWQQNFNYKYRTFEVTGVDMDVVFEILMKYSGYKYGVLDLPRHWFYHKTGLWLGINKEHKRVVCSEIVMLVLEDLGVYNGENTHRMTPEGVLEYCETYLKEVKSPL